MAAARKAAVYVTVGLQTFAPGEEIPGDLVELIDNPTVWGEDKETAADPEDPADEVFDPSSADVDGVNNYLANADADEVARVLQAEADGKNRKGIVEGPYAGEAD